MIDHDAEVDPYLGLTLGKYTISARVGHGQIGRVYKAEDKRIGALQACKFIAEPRPGWENEITKVVKLHGVPHVVSYRDHDWAIVEGKKVLYILWDYIPGTSLRDMAETGKITVSLITEVVSSVLTVLGACQARGIVHADLHWGNILVQDPDESVRPIQRRIWITDFGYYTASMGGAEGKHLLDDIYGLASIVSQCRGCIDFHELDARERQIYRVLRDELPKYLHETSTVEEPAASELPPIFRQLPGRIKMS